MNNHLLKSGSRLKNRSLYSKITKVFDDNFIPFDDKFILRSDESKSLKFQGKIKSSYFLLGSLIPLEVKVSKNDCFTLNGKTRSPITTIIDIGAQLGSQEFNLPIVAEGVDKFFHKKSGDVKINFQNRRQQHRI